MLLQTPLTVSKDNLYKISSKSVNILTSLVPQPGEAYAKKFQVYASNFHNFGDRGLKFGMMLYH